MKTKFILGMAMVSVLQAAAPAVAQNRGAGPLPPPPPSSVRERHQEGSVEIQRITRASQGQWYRVSLRNRIRLDRVEVSVLSERLKIHEANVITASGNRVDIRELKNSSILAAGSRIISENLNIREDILTIDIRAESHGGFADLRVSAFSSDDRPQLVLGDLNSGGGGRPNNPNRPNNPGRPQEPNRPDRPSQYCSSDDQVVTELESLSVDLSTWLERMGQSSYASASYNMASREAENVGNRMVALAQSGRASKASLNSLEELAKRSLNRMVTFSYNSLGYNTHMKVAQAIHSALALALDEAVKCEIKTTKELLAKGDEFLAKGNAYSYNSVGYNSYQGLAFKAFGMASAFYRSEVSRSRLTFFDINKDLGDFYTKMVSYSYNSVGYNSYQTLLQTGELLAQADLTNSLRRLSANERFELLRVFEGSRNQYSYNSLLYNHFEQMRSILANGR